MKKIEGKVGLVTGGGSGNGKGIALRMAKDGAKAVIVNDVDGALAEEVAREIKETYQTEALPVQADVSSEVEVENMFEEILKRFGRLDILVHCAGIISVNKAVEESLEAWDRLFAVNVRGTFLCCRAAARQMMRQKSGKILIASSGAGLVGITYLSAYSASKAALIRFGEVLARELGPYGICVNVFSPGWSPWSKMGWETCQALAKHLGVDPEEIARLHARGVPLGREATVEDTANLVSFLYSDEANYITGQMIVVGGGATSGRDLVPLSLLQKNEQS